MKQLILMRHAKSDWSQGGLSDFERPLNKRGTHDASNMGKWMAQEIELPDIILCSSARRTQQTKQLLLLSLQTECDHTQEIEQIDFDEMYLASTNTLNNLAKSHLNTHGCVMLIAHNPGMDGILTHYAPNAPRSSSGKLMTTANIAVIEFDDLLNPELKTLQRPKEL